MPREPIFTVETRTTGEPWQMAWRGQGEQVACDAARALAAETRKYAGWDVLIHVHSYVQVRQGKRIVVRYAGGKAVA
jgi:hypothetical protein